MSRHLPAAKAQPLENLSFEAAMKELEEIVRKLEGGQADLESSIADYARGAELQRHCQKKLDDAKLKIDAVMKSANGEMKLEPFES